MDKAAHAASAPGTTPGGEGLGLDLRATKPYAEGMESSSRTLPAPLRVLRLSALSALGLFACSGDPQPPPVVPATTAPETKQETETATPENKEAPAAETPDAGAADAQASKPKPASSQGGGRPPVLKSDPEGITDTFGSTPGAKLEIGEGEDIAVLRLPEGTLDRGYNITFRLEPKGKSLGVPVGKIYRTLTQVAGSPNFSKLESVGSPFQLVFPAGNKKDANLAIGEIITDSNAREKIVWRIIAPLKIDDVLGRAHFELTWLADAFLHITTKAPTENKP
jgi:hypothetical protein